MLVFILNYLFGFLFLKKILIAFVFLLLITAFITLIERKIIGNLQKRRGPNLIGIVGLFQPLADGVKLLLKELVIPGFSNKIPFILSSLFSLILSIFSWYLIPFHDQYVLSEIRIGFIYILTIVSLGIYCILISGWSSNSKFAIVGSIRSAAQMISYEISLGIIFIIIFICFGSVKLNEIILCQNYSYFFFFIIPIFYIFIVAQLAEINRLPFDLPEAEAELVSGYNVEYSGVSFVFFNIGEYLHNILLSNVLNTFFFWWLNFTFFHIINYTFRRFIGNFFKIIFLNIFCFFYSWCFFTLQIWSTNVFKLIFFCTYFNLFFLFLLLIDFYRLNNKNKLIN